MTPATKLDQRPRPTDADAVNPRKLVEPPWIPPIERLAPRLAGLLPRRPLRFAEASARMGAYVYGNLVVLGTLLAMSPTTAVSTHGALTVLAAGLSTFVAHAFADLLAHRIGHGHRSALHAAAAAARSSLPIVTSAVVPLGILTAGAILGWAVAPTALAADLFICVRIGMIGAAAERFCGTPSSRRFVLVGIGIAAAAAVVAVAKALIGG